MEYIQEKYNKFHIKEIQSGYRCKTFLLSKENEKIIYQIYLDSNKYQAKKKKYVTELIKDNIEINEIPNIIDFGEKNEFSFLVTEFKDGKELKINDNFNYKVFYNNLAQILSKIHSIKLKENLFGWIDGTKIIGKKHFYEYIIDDVKRNIQRIENSNIIDNKLIENINDKYQIALNFIKEYINLTPVINWYDINENNILVKESGEIIGFLDPGGARFGVKEWDLAFVKMELCKNNDEYEFFKNSYKSVNNMDENLLNMLSIIVEIDDIAFQVESKVKLPIPYCTNFEDVLREIHKKF